MQLTGLSCRTDRGYGICMLMQEAIGSVTGSKDWQQSGQKDKQGAVDEMRAASQDRKEAQDQRASSGSSWVAKEGAVESVAGKLTGCEGMKQEGETKQQGGSH